ncbi:MAG: acyl-CoA thioesterase [Spartobacteria bacterium]
MPAPATHVYRRNIRFADTDAAGVAHFSRLLAIVEEAIHDFFQIRGVPILDAANAWPVVSIHADYSAGCRFQDEITVSLSIEKIGTSSLGFSFTAAKADGTACFGGKATLCHIDPALHAPAPIPAKTRDALGATPA